MGEQKKSHKAGKNKIKCGEYRVDGRRYISKLTRVLASNGPVAALDWAKKYECYAALRKVARRAPTLFQNAVEANEEFRRWSQGR